MTINYDNIADAAYFKLSDAKIASTQKVEDKLIVDSDADGNIVGIEILDLSSNKEVIENLRKNVSGGVPIEMISSTPSLA